MARSEYEEDDGYDSVGEDAELELSCALHDLAERVKTFEETMKGQLRIHGIDADGDNGGEEIGEEIPEVKDDHHGGYGYASPKKSALQSKSKSRGRRSSAKQTKQQDDDDEHDYCDDDDEEEEQEERDAKQESKSNRRIDWDEQSEREELSEMKSNISKLLQGFNEQAKVLEADALNGNQ